MSRRITLASRPSALSWAMAALAAAMDAERYREQGADWLATLRDRDKRFCVEQAFLHLPQQPTTTRTEGDAACA